MNNLAESHVLSRLGLPGQAELFDMQSIWKMNKARTFYSKLRVNLQNVQRWTNQGHFPFELKHSHSYGNCPN